MSRRNPRQGSPAFFPGPLSAFLITVAAVFALALVAAIFSSLPLVTALGLGKALGLGGVATLAARRVPAPQGERLGLRGFSPRQLLALLCLLPVVIVLSEVDNQLRDVVPAVEPMPEVAAMAAELKLVDSLLTVIQLAIVEAGITPIVEGFLFFGVLLQGLVSHLGRLRGLLLTGLLFSLVHLPPTAAPGQAISPVLAAFVSGLLFGLARLSTGSILAPMGVSAFMSAAGITALALADDFRIPGFNETGGHTPAALWLPCLASVVLGVVLLLRRLPDSPDATVLRLPPAEEVGSDFHV